DVFDDGRSVTSEPRVEGAAGERVLGLPGASSITRRMDRLFFARPDPTFVFLHGRRGAAVFDRRPDGQGPVAIADGRSRLRARVHSDLPGHLPAFGQPADDLFHV